MSKEKPFRTFADFYPFYLSEHANRISRRLHFVGTSIAAALLITALVTQLWWLVAVALIQGYAFAWVGHFTYFGLLLYAVVPTLILGLFGKASWRWATLVTAAILIVQYHGLLHVRPHFAVRF